MHATALAPKTVIHRLGPPPPRRRTPRMPSRTGRWLDWIVAKIFQS